MGHELWWNVRPGHPAAANANFRIQTDSGRVASIQYSGSGVALKIDGKLIATVDSGVARLVTNLDGRALALLGVSEEPQEVRLKMNGRASILQLKPNQHVLLQAL